MSNAREIIDSLLDRINELKNAEKAMVRLEVVRDILRSRLKHDVPLPKWADEDEMQCIYRLVCECFPED